MALSIDQLINEVAASGLVSAAELLAWLSMMPQAQRPKNGEELARELVEHEKLTKFQAEQIYAGQGKSLTLGNYLILDKLGQGGMGLVLKAMHRRMERVVALKVMSQAGMKSPDAVQRFHREVKAAAKLHHPNIVTAFDADEANGTHFLVMEYVEGMDLSAFVKKHGPLPIDQAVQCILQAARGLEFAHSRGVIHRDIKPSNLLMTMASGSSSVAKDSSHRPETTNHGLTIKILDMGLARIDNGVDAQAELTTTGAVMGTVDYMAPEQALSAKSADARSDIYSLGITLWYLLTGRVAYEGDSMMSKLLAHRDAAIPSLTEEFRRVGQPSGDPPSSDALGIESSFAPTGGSRGLDPPCGVLDAVFRKMVAKQAKDRYQSMAEVILDLERCLAGTAPIAASQPSTVSAATRTEDSSQAIAPLASGDRNSGASPSGTTAGSLATAVSCSDAEAETIVLSAESGGTDPHTDLSLTLEAARPQRSASPGPTNKMRLALFGSIATAVMALLAIVFSRNDQPAQRLGESELSRANQKASEPDFALEFDFQRHPSTRIAIPLGSLDPNRPWTLEGYIQPADIPDHNHGLLAIFEGDAWQLNLNHWTLRFVEQSGSLKQQPNRSENVIAETLAEKWRGRRVHLAGVFDGQQAALFVDGKLIGKAPPKFLPKQHPGKLFLGARFSGRMDEWRISKVARYDNDFTPPLRYESDADTLALFHFDDGEGSRLHDSSGNNHHGEITDAQWVKVNDATGVTPAIDPVVSAMPFVILRNGTEAARHATLEEALNAVQSQDVIEVHGNGPFPIGGPKAIPVGGRTENVLTLKAASGFRPLFVSIPGTGDNETTLFDIHCDTTRFEDIDFVLAGPATFGFYGVRDVAFLRCRCVSTSKAPGVLMGFHCAPEQRIRFSDCLVASGRREGALKIMGSPARIEMSNSFLMARGNPLEVDAGGSTIQLNRCTVIGSSATVWFPPMNEKERSVPGTAGLSRCLVFGVPYIGDHVRWQGNENVYGISALGQSGISLPGDVRLSFDEWINSPAKPETGSRLVSTKAKQFDELLDQNPAVMFGKLKSYLEELRTLHPDVGADLAVADGQPLQRTTTAEIGKSPDRRAAEWVIAQGGTIYVNGLEEKISNVTDLPSNDFKLTTVRLNGKSFSSEDADLAPLRALRNLSCVSLDSSNVSPAGIAGLAQIPTLKRVSRGGMQLGNERLAALAEIKTLQQAYLAGARITQEQCTFIAKSMPQLTGLNLTDNQLLDDAAIEPLGRMTKLIDLQLKGTRVTATGVAPPQKALPGSGISWDGSAK